MYLKYTITSGTTRQVQDEIGDLLMGVITDQSTTVYGNATIDGTMPTNGIYTRTSSATDVHLVLQKKHCQWHVSTLPAVMTLRIFNSNGAAATLMVADKNGANSTFTESMANQGGLQIGSITIGTEYHFIINDTTLAMQVIAPNTSGQSAQRYGGVIWSDFEKTEYDEYAIGENPLYYPGCAVSWANQNPDSPDVLVSDAGFWVHRFQFQNSANGNFYNTTGSTTQSSQYSFDASGDQQDGSPYFSTNPMPQKPLWKTWGPAGHTIAMIPLMLNGHGQRWIGASETHLSNLGIDSRWHSTMLNTYRMSTGTGITGDFVEDAASSRYYIFAGQRTRNVTPGLSSTNSSTVTGCYLQALYAFPKDNVPIA